MKRSCGSWFEGRFWLLCLPIAYRTTKALRPVLINSLINLVVQSVSANQSPGLFPWYQGLLQGIRAIEAFSWADLLAMSDLYERVP
jgi:hypothetical protein